MASHSNTEELVEEKWSYKSAQKFLQSRSSALAEATGKKDYAGVVSFVSVGDKQRNELVRELRIEEDNEESYVEPSDDAPVLIRDREVKRLEDVSPRDEILAFYEVYVSEGGELVIAKYVPDNDSSIIDRVLLRDHTTWDRFSAHSESMDFGQIDSKLDDFSGHGEMHFKDANKVLSEKVTPSQIVDETEEE